MDKKSILLVEDNTCLRCLLKDYLGKNYNVYEASGYREAIEHLDSKIDLAITDHDLPDGDGFEVIKAFRKINPTIPIIMITGNGNKSIEETALKLRVADYIEKPLRIKHLEQRISEILCLQVK